MAQQPLPPPPPGEIGGPAWIRWFNLILDRLTKAAQLAWTQIDFTGSTLANIVTRNHNDLQNIQGGAAGDYQHLTTAQVAIVGGVAATYAPLASPALTGTPTAPTAPTGTNTTQLATTAFVQNDINSSVLLWIETY